MPRDIETAPPAERGGRLLPALVALVLTVGASSVLGPSAQATPGVPDSLFLSSPGQVATGTQAVLTASVFDDGFQSVDGVEVTFEVYRDGDRDGEVDAADPIDERIGRHGGRRRR